MKRALITFGNPFGLALYDKSQRQVSGSAQGQGQSQGQCRRPFRANQQLRMGNPPDRTFVKPSVTGR